MMWERFKSRSKLAVARIELSINPRLAGIIVASEQNASIPRTNHLKKEFGIDREYWVKKKSKSSNVLRLSKSVVKILSSQCDSVFHVAHWFSRCG